MPPTKPVKKRSPPVLSPTVAHKLCKKCGNKKPATMFSRSRANADGLNSRCKPCDSDHQKEYRERDPAGYLARVRQRALKYRRKHPERVRANWKKWRARGRDTIVNGDLRRTFGISLADYNAMLKAQGGTCAICRRPETFKLAGKARPRLSVDHDHQTGKIRGLLCHKCNRGLGNFEDDVKRLLAAGAYLIRTKKRSGKAVTVPRRA